MLSGVLLFVSKQQNIYTHIIYKHVFHFKKIQKTNDFVRVNNMYFKIDFFNAIDKKNTLHFFSKDCNTF